jgi:hypothetical protein
VRAGRPVFFARLPSDPARITVVKRDLYRPGYGWQPGSCRFKGIPVFGAVKSRRIEWFFPPHLYADWLRRYFVVASLRITQGIAFWRLPSTTLGTAFSRFSLGLALKQNK